MRNIGFSLGEISKKTVFSIFTILQLTISFILLFVSISINNNMNVKVKYMNKIFKDKNYYIINTSESKPLETTSLSDVKKFEELIESNNIELYSVQRDSVFISSDRLNKEYLANFDRININNKLFQRVKSIYVNDKYIDNIGINLVKGSFEDSDDRTPVILGYNYKGIINLHDQIPYIYTEENGEQIIRYFDVCGFADKDNVISIKGTPDDIVDLGNYIIIPLNVNSNINNSKDEMVRKINIFNYYSNGYFSFETDEDKEEIESYSRELGLNYKFESINDKITKFMKEYRTNTLQIKTFFISMLVFTIISIVMVMLNMVISNKKEYAINMLVGASSKDIALRIFYEILILFSVSTILALIIIDKFIKDNQLINVNLKNIVCLLVFAAFVCVIVSIIPIMKFKSTSINDIIKGDE